MHSERLALRPREACRWLGVSLRTLHTWTKQGRIPHLRVGKVVLYPVTELEAWLREQTKVTTQASSNPPAPVAKPVSSPTVRDRKRQS